MDVFEGVVVAVVVVVVALVVAARGVAMLWPFQEIYRANVLLVSPLEAQVPSRLMRSK